MKEFSYKSKPKIIKGDEQILDFVENRVSEEREFYEEYYQTKTVESLDFNDKLYLFPEHKLILDVLVSVQNARVLLLGNGLSAKEVIFCDQNNVVFYSDYTVTACLQAQKYYSNKNNIVFGAIDALDMPFEDESIDFIYAYGVVHHLEDLNGFFAECNRILTFGGSTCFFDDAYSKPWVLMKNKFFRNIRDKSHKKNGISPEDVRFSNTGGFDELELKKIAAKHNLKYSGKRTGFFHYIFVRLIEKLISKRMLKTTFVKLVLKFFIIADKLTLRLFPKWGIRLVWQVKK